MENITAFGIIAGVLAVVLGIALVKQRSQLLWNFIVRTVLGAIGIIFTNDFLAAQGIAVAAGLNPVSLLTVGSLGLGGFAVLYGILFTQLL